jgi:PEP-CTERM motif-containing protein
MRTVCRAMVMVGLVIGSSIFVMAGDESIPIPEPSSLLVLASSLAIMGAMLRRKIG